MFVRRRINLSRNSTQTATGYDINGWRSACKVRIIIRKFEDTVSEAISRVRFDANVGDGVDKWNTRHIRVVFSKMECPLGILPLKDNGGPYIF